MRDTIEMAREAGLHIPYWGEEEDPKKDPPRWTMVSPLPPLLKAFEALVRADERNSWPAEMEAMERQVNILTDALADEREACAKVAEWEPCMTDTPKRIAAAIRARRNT
jgi:hypothetical protein